MAEVLLFHAAQGQTPGFHAFAEQLRAAGHTVHAPDLFDGRTFATIGEGMAYAEELGFPDEILARGERAAETLPAGLVDAGFSLGVLPAQRLAQTRPGARGMEDDPVFAGEGDLEAAREIVATADAAELFLYPGDQHYFADSSLPLCDAAATRLLTERVLGFLG
jgi:dienelactone hydrolase